MRGTLEERFWAKVRRGRGRACWIWTASLDGYDYGQIYAGPGRAPAKAHRLSWEIANGPIPDDQDVLHRCDTPSCVRPDHLFLGTQRSNIEDAARKGRMKRGELHYRAKLTAWIHIRVDRPEAGDDSDAVYGRLVDARLDVKGKHASDTDAGDFDDPGLYHLAVRVARDPVQT